MRKAPEGEAPDEQKLRLALVLELLREEGVQGDIALKTLQRLADVIFEQNDRAEGLLWLLWKDFKEGFISLEKLLHRAIGVLDKTVADSRRRDQLLAKLVRSAHAVTPKRRGRGPKGLPPSIRYLARDAALYLAKHSGAALSSPRTKDAVIQVLSEWGVPLTPDQVKELCRPRPRAPRRRG